MSVEHRKSNTIPQADPACPGSGLAVCGPNAGSGAESRLRVEEPGGDRVPSGTVARERMREVLRRLSSDYYNSPEVRDTVASGVRRDLGLSRSE